MPTHRAAVIARARQILADRPIFLDTETTGLDPRAEIVEIALIDHDGGVLLDSLVKPTGPIPWDATRVHNISNEMVANAPTWTELWPQIQALLNGRRVGIYNAEFDLRMIAQSHASRKVADTAAGSNAFCIMKLYAEFFGERGSYGDYKWQSLDKAARQCGIGLPNSHRAAADARLARAVLEAISKAA
ncbi:MAG: 3'-5' exonuclease [Caldilineaceae bacterium]|nr:3'-5' exonuclease [Caldilineaceae bacterium]